MAAPRPIELRSGRLDWSRAYIVGILNATPDSFSDGGRYATVEAAVARAEALVEAGADIIDVGGESTRPQKPTPVTAAEERQRVIPIIERLAGRLPVPIAVDTTKAEVAAAAVDAGAELVNDISGGLFDPALPAVAGARGAVLICGHVRGTTLREIHEAEAAPPSFDEVLAELTQRVAELPPALDGRTIVDPCLGFGKRREQNLELTRRAGELSDALSCAVMVGPSRKRFLGELTGAAVDRRDSATIGAALAAVAAGAHLVRVHEVAALRDALVVFQAARRA